MTDTATPAALVAERLELCQFLRSLDEQDWAAPSLCAGWTNHDVVAHLTLSTRTSAFDFAKGMLRHRGDFDQMNAVDARRRAGEFAPAALLDQLQADAHSTKKSLGSSPEDGLTDVIVHGQDIARGIGRPLPVAADRVELALDHVVASRWYPAKKALEGMAVTAVDSEWSHGTGSDTIAGPVIELLLAATGRQTALEQLTGTGVDVVRRRLAQ